MLIRRSSSVSLSRRPGRGAARASAVGLALVLLAGCSGDDTPVVTRTGTDAPTSDTTEPGTPNPGPLVPDGIDEALVPFYSQQIAWQACGDRECATVEAPLDWADAGAGSTRLALERAVAEGEAQGSLLINPGGPGASGIDFLDYGVSLISPEVREQFHVVGFDPRGVAASDGVACLDDAAKDAALSKDYDYSSPEGLAELEADATAYGEACLEKTGELLGHVDTQSAAKDMDLIRALVGDEKLNYLGYSYGTQLGAAYAGQFPDRVGRLVLDGAVDITLDADESSLQQAQGFERALRAYVTDCQENEDSCPLTGSVDDGLAQIKALVDAAYENPLPTDSGRELTQTLAFYGIAVTLYNDSSWPMLTDALAGAIGEGDGTYLLYLADVYNDRQADGTFASNSSEAFRAIGCLDGRGNSDPAHMAAEAERIREAAPTLGESFGYGALLCKNWPVPAAEVTYDISAPGAAPIVVIGTTNDPATPYEWSQALAKTLESAVLVTWEGEGHTAYGRSNECITEAVDQYLLEGTVPQDGLQC